MQVLSRIPSSRSAVPGNKCRQVVNVVVPGVHLADCADAGPLRPRYPRGPHVREGLGTRRSRRGPCARSDPRAAGNGVRRARGSARRHRPLHHDRVPRGLRDLRALARPGPRSGLLGVTADLRGDRTTARHGRFGERGRARRHARLARRRDRDRARHLPAGFRGRPALERGASRVHERIGRHDRGEPTAEALRLLDRR